MATVNGESGFTQLTKLNLTEELWLRGIPVSSMSSGLYTGIGVVGGDISTRDGFFSFGDNKSLLVTNQVIWVNVSDVAFAYKWDGVDNPPSYDIDDWTQMSVGVTPASLIIGANDLQQAGVFLSVVSDLDNSKRFQLGRQYDDTGSFDITSEKLGLFGQIDLLDLTGTRFTFTSGLELEGGAAPGVNAYQTALALFVYDEVINFGLQGRVDSFDGPLATTVTNFNAPSPPTFTVTNITNANPAVVTAPGHTYTNGERRGIGSVLGMTEINDLVSFITVSGDDITFTEIDSTAFTPYSGGGITQGGLVMIPLDNPNRVNPSQIYFTTITVDQDFDVDGQEVAPGFFLPYNPVFGQSILSVETVITDDGAGNVTIPGNVIVDGDAHVKGTLTATNTSQLNVSEANIYLNNGYISTTQVPASIVTNNGSTGTSDTVTAGSFTAGIAATSNPTVVTDGSATFAQNDLIQISETFEGENNGIYEVESHVGTLLTVRGVGTIQRVETFTQDQFVANASDSCIITKINISVIRSSGADTWEIGAGSETAIVFNELVDEKSTGIAVISTGLGKIKKSFDTVGALNFDNVRLNIDYIRAYFTQSTPPSTTIDVRVGYNNVGVSDPHNGEIYFTGSSTPSAKGSFSVLLTPTATPIPDEADIFFDVQSSKTGAGIITYDGTTIGYTGV